MKFTDIYFDYKNRYENYIIIYKVGNFYNVLGKDTVILHEIMHYQIKEHTGIPKIGFPIISLEKVLRALTKAKMNYLVLEKEEGIVKIKIKKRFKDNAYEDYSKQSESLYEKKEQIKKVENLLLEKIEDADFSLYIKRIEELL